MLFFLFVLSVSEMSEISDSSRALTLNGTFHGTSLASHDLSVEKGWHGCWNVGFVGFVGFLGVFFFIFSLSGSETSEMSDSWSYTPGSHD